MVLDAQNLSYVLGILGLISILLTAYNSYRNPQIDTDKTTLKLREDIDTLKEIVDEVKEKHLRAVEQDLRKLSDTIQQLSTTVVKLSTIIEERVPRLK